MRKRYQIFVSSTYEDLIEERKEAVQAILESDCFPAGMELFPASNKKQWEIIKKVIDDSDFYLLIIAGRYGSIGEDEDGKKISYTEMEFNYAKKQDKPIFALIHKNPDLLTAKRVERSKSGIDKLKKFKGDVTNSGTVMFWTNKDDLKSAVLKTLKDRLMDTGTINGEDRYRGWVKYTSEFNWMKERESVNTFIADAQKEIFITGNALNSLYQSVTLFQTLLKRGVVIKLVLLSDEGLEENCRQLGAGFKKMSNLISLTLSRLKTYQEKDLQKQLWVKQVKEPIWTNIIAKDIDQNNGVIGVNHLLPGVATEDCLYVEFTKENKFYNTYKSYMNDIWERGSLVDFDKIEKE